MKRVSLEQLSPPEPHPLHPALQCSWPGPETKGAGAAGTPTAAVGLPVILEQWHYPFTLVLGGPRLALSWWEKYELKGHQADMS